MMTTLHSPAISIATCSYSRKAFLKTTMFSVFGQSGVSTEYIVINGVLPDRSATAIEKYSPGISYWVSKPDSWQSQALDKCLRRPLGDIVAWLLSNDVLLLGALQKIVNYHAEVDAVYGNTVVIDAKDNR